MARSRRPLTSPAPSSRGWTWAALGALCGLTLGLALFAPSRWAAAAVNRATEGRVLLQAARGTVWDGSAQLVLTGGPGSRDAATLPTRLEWQLHLRPNALLLRLSSECCTPAPLQLRVQPRWRGGAVAVADGQPSRWPAALLAGLGTPWNTLDLEGELQLATRGLSIAWAEGRVQVAGQADLSARHITSRLTTLRPMGSYQLRVAGGSTPSLQLQTLEGPLQITGSGQWVGSRLRFTGEATAAPEREAALSNLLNIIGRRSGARSLITIG